jgi:hypothetical protein
MGEVRYRAPGGEGEVELDRFEILNEPTGMYYIFDKSTELPATADGTTCIGLQRHEVPLALLAIMTSAADNGWLPPSLSSLGNCRTNNTDR